MVVPLLVLDGERGERGKEEKGSGWKM